MTHYSYTRGFTLIELTVSVGLFALVMMLASGSYVMMIGLNRQAQGMTSGINNLSFVLESMTRSIRSGSVYNCGGLGDCPFGSSSFSFKDEKGVNVSYSLNGSTIQKTSNSVADALTDPSVTVTSLMFYAFGTRPASAGDYEQSRVTIIVSGTVSAGAGKTQSFTVETGAVMRGTDL